MSLEALTKPFPWSLYSKKLLTKLERLRCFGIFTKQESQERGMHLIEGASGSLEEGNRLCLFWLIDEEDGVIVDAKFQAYGQSALLGAAEIACELLIGKNYDQAKRITEELIDKQVRDKSDREAFPQDTSYHLNLVLEAIDKAAEACQIEGVPLAATYIALPAPREIGEVLEGGYPGWESLSHREKLALIEAVIAEDIRPYIELDAGGISLVDLKGENEVLIAYEGSCTSCFSATGTTLAYIQQILRAKVHPSLDVIPQF